MLSCIMLLLKMIVRLKKGKIKRWISATIVNRPVQIIEHGNRKFTVITAQGREGSAY